MEHPIIRNLRNASRPRVWARSRHHGPTSYDGPNPRPRRSAALGRMLSGRAKAPSTWALVAIALALTGLGFLDESVQVAWLFAGVTGIAILGKPGRRLEFLAVVACASLLVYMTWGIIASLLG